MYSGAERNEHDQVKCGSCSGSGQVEVDNGCEDDSHTYEECRTCNGSGYED